MAARILIIEDDSASLELIKYMLEKAGYLVGSAMTGLDGVRAARKNDFDLVLCDLQLPEMSGFEVVSRLTKDPGWRAVPVIAVTAYSMPGDRSAALEAGFTEYLTKPIDPESFLQEIGRHIPQGLAPRGN